MLARYLRWRSTSFIVSLVGALGLLALGPFLHPEPGLAGLWTDAWLGVPMALGYALAGVLSMVIHARRRYPGLVANADRNLFHHKSHDAGA